MLVLSRKKEESIVLGDSIIVTIIDIKSDHIRIGIDAPRDVAIYRKEIYDQIQKQNLEAAKAPTDNMAFDALANLLPGGPPSTKNSGKPKK